MQDVLCRTEIEFGKPVTYVTVRMENGFTIRESTTCVDPANYNEEIGKKICLDKIRDTIYLLLGYELQSQIKTESAISESDNTTARVLHLLNDVIVTATDGEHLSISNDNHLYQVDDKGELHISLTPQCKQNFHHDLNMHAVTGMENLEIPFTYCAICALKLVIFKPMKNNEALFFSEGVIEIIHDFKDWASKLDYGLVFELTRPE